MIIIPELETVVITPPRTASTSLFDAVHKTYSNSFSPYRHMEANGIPTGYDMWRKIGVVREPLDRLWSLYKYTFKSKHKPEFNKWILNENVPLVTGFDCRYKAFDVFEPYYTCLVSLPETMKSQFYYLRPDLGTKIIRFDRLGELEEELDLIMINKNETEKIKMPEITEEVERHMKTFFSWDLDQFKT